MYKLKSSFLKIIEIGTKISKCLYFTQFFSCLSAHLLLTYWFVSCACFSVQCAVKFSNINKLWFPQAINYTLKCVYVYNFLSFFFHFLYISYFESYFPWCCSCLMFLNKFVFYRNISSTKQTNIFVSTYARANDRSVYLF